MKSRLAKKIARQTFRFSNWDTNYQPYSINQQKKAIKVATKGYSADAKQCLYSFGIVKKVPTKEKKNFSPFRTVW